MVRGDEGEFALNNDETTNGALCKRRMAGGKWHRGLFFGVAYA